MRTHTQNLNKAIFEEMSVNRLSSRKKVPVFIIIDNFTSWQNSLCLYKNAKKCTYIRIKA